MRPAVFLDRDDTLIECNGLPAPPPPARPGDLVDPAQVRLLPGVAPALSRLANAGFALVVVSNQGVVARGGADVRRVEAVNDALRERLRDEGGPAIDAVYFCPFHPQGTVPEFTREHPWRKPSGGMLLAAAEDLGLDLAASWLIGDAQRDVDAGIHAGLGRERCLLIGGGFDLPDVAAAADVVLAAVGRLPEAVGGLTTLTLRAVSAALLEDARTRSTVLASVRGAADRAGVRAPEVAVQDGVLRVTLAADRLAGLGLLMEIRRATNRWHQARQGVPLWAGEEP